MVPYEDTTTNPQSVFVVGGMFDRLCGWFGVQGGGHIIDSGNNLNDKIKQK